jgi:ribosomal protein S18 acetylase RimI-like enzyme
MSKPVEIIPFRAEHIEAAAKLLTHRTQQEQMSKKFYFQIAEKAITNLWGKPPVFGIAATIDGELIGYLISYAIIDAMMGRTAWIPIDGYAIAQGQSNELYRDMYAALSSKWVNNGIFDHVVMVAAENKVLLDTWFSLSFGQEQAYGKCALEDYQSPELPESGVTIRLATPNDKDSLYNLGDTIVRYQMRAPVFATALPEEIIEYREGYAGLVDENDVIVWLAEQDGLVLGMQAYFPVELDTTDLLNPSNSIELKVGATLESIRGQGVGKQLTYQGLLHAKQSGYDYCVTDWRTTNLLSSRFWPHMGFRPIAYRLSRHIDERIVWAQD